MVGLAVAEAAVEAAGQEPVEYLFAVEVGADGVDDTGHQHGDGESVIGGAGLLEFVEQHVELDRVAVAVAGYGSGQEAGIGQGGVERLVVERAGPMHRVDDLVGEVGVEKGHDLGAELGGAWREREVHHAAPRSRSAIRRHSRAGSSNTSDQALARR